MALRSNWHNVWRLMLGVFLLAALVLLAVREGGQLQAALHVLRTVRVWPLAVACAAFICTFAFAAYIYLQLAFKPLRYGATVLVEVASAGVNRLVPAGLGALGLHGLYLYKRRHSVAQATAVVSINNLIGMVAHLTLLLIVLGVGRGEAAPLKFHAPAQVLAVAAVILLIAAAVLAGMRLVRKRVASFARNLGASLRRYAAQPSKLLRAYAGAVGLTLLYVLMFAMCARAAGVSLTFYGAFMAFSVGTLAGTAVPTPGGLAGAEAGFFAGLVAYGASVPTATAAVVVYRLLTYWLPLPVGFVALGLARRHKLV